MPGSTTASTADSSGAPEPQERQCYSSLTCGTVRRRGRIQLYGCLGGMGAAAGALVVAPTTELVVQTLGAASAARLGVLEPPESQERR